MIVCDYCDARTRQPLPHGWRVLWLPELQAYGHACLSCGERLDGGERLARAAITDARGTHVVAAATVTVPLERAESFASELEAAFRDELGLPAAEADHELRDLPQGDKSTREPSLSTHAPHAPHGSDAPASAVDEPTAEARRDAGAIRPPVPKLIEPAPGVEIYDRPRLPRTLRDAPDGASVADFVRKVGETFVPPAATRPRAAAPLVKSPSEPPPPAQRSLFGGES